MGDTAKPELQGGLEGCAGMWGSAPSVGAGEQRVSAELWQAPGWAYIGL